MYETIKNMMGMERDIVDEVQRKQLVWYGDTCRMDEERIPNRVFYNGHHRRNGREVAPDDVGWTT